MPAKSNVSGASTTNLMVPMAKVKGVPKFTNPKHIYWEVGTPDDETLQELFTIAVIDKAYPPGYAPKVICHPTMTYRQIITNIIEHVKKGTKQKLKDVDGTVKK